MIDTKLYSEVENLFNSDIAEMQLSFLNSFSGQNEWTEFIEGYFLLNNWTQEQIKNNLDDLVSKGFICRKTVPIDGENASFYLWNEELNYERFKF